MNRALWLLTCSLSFLPTLPAQDPGKPIEVLRDLARERVERMEARFQDTLERALAAFRRPADPANQATVRAAHEELGRWAGTFHEDLLGTYEKTTSERVRRRLLGVLIDRGGPEITMALLELVDPEKVPASLRILDALRTVEEPGAEALEALSEGIDGRLAQDDRLEAAGLYLLASHGHSSAIEAARDRVADESSLVRRAAAFAIGRGSDDPRRDVKRLLPLAIEDPDSEVRTVALRALGSFPDNFEAQQGLNEVLATSEEPKILKAALEAARRSGSEKISTRAMFRIVETSELPDDVRETAARLLYRAGDDRGIELLVRGLKEFIRRQPRRFRLHKQLGDRYLELGAYTEALQAYAEAKRVDRARGAELHTPVARCFAHLGRFREAERALEAAGYTASWSRFAGDPAFAEMKEHPRYEERFEP